MLSPLNDTTYSERTGHLEAVVGDEKQAAFYPRIKLKAWGNESNLSIGLLDTTGRVNFDEGTVLWEGREATARFYVAAAPTSRRPQDIAYCPLGGIDSYQITADYDNNHRFTKPTVVTYWSNEPAIMLFQQYYASDYLTDNCDIPIVRASSNDGNPYYMDKGLPMLIFHYRPGEFTAIGAWHSAVIDTLARLGIKAYHRGDTKLYVRDGTKDVKISSPQEYNGRLWTYLNIDCQYNRAYDYYREGRVKDIRDIYAYGLQQIYPDKDFSSFFSDVTLAFLKRLGLPHQKEQYPFDLTAKQDIYTSSDWVQLARRFDADWFRPRHEPVAEFEIIFTSRPSSNRIPLSLQLKNIRLYYQSELNEQERLTLERPPNVVGSYAAYTTNSGYGTGKMFHLYRPLATDAAGRSVWCDLVLDSPAIVVPQEFIDNATYPIVIDPTFGYTTAGATAGTSGNIIQGLTPTGIWGQYVNIYAYRDVLSSSNVTDKCAVYNHSTEALIQQTNEYSNSANVAAAWTKFTLNAPAALSSGTTYRLLHWSNIPGAYQAARLYSDTLTNAGIQKSVTYGAWPDPLTTMTVNNSRYSIYITGPDPVNIINANF